MTALSLASLIASRLCHDLIGPVGAFNNGLELMEMEEDPAMRDSAVDLLQHSASLATNKLKYLRLAFGASGGDQNGLDMGSVRAAVDAYFAESRFTINWPQQPSGDGDIPKSMIRLLMNLMMCASTALFRGGEMQVLVSASAIRLLCNNPDARLNDDMVNALTGATVAEKHEHARIIEAFLAQAIARDINAKITVDQSTNGFAISVQTG